jgi:membrane protease YdiL (CAAX protease family)
MSTDFTSAAPLEPTGSPSQPPSAVHTVFMGPNGIRAGWRSLLFLLFVIAVGAAMQFAVFHIPGFREWVRSLTPGVMTPVSQIVSEFFMLFPVIVAAIIMSRIERRSFADYGFPGNQAFGKRFWLGIPFGFAMVSLMMVLIALLRGFSIEGIAIHGQQAAKAGVLYGIGFVMVGIFEEFSFRGYLQSTLGSGMGFWPAAIVLSVLFGAVHLQNQGEAWVGALTAGSFGVVAALSLRRTGTIWFAIGMHAAFDWGETYLYSVADSGFLAQDHLLNSSFHGPLWLTGGSVGPEGSVMAFVTLILSAAAIHFVFPAQHRSF